MFCVTFINLLRSVQMGAKKGKHISLGPLIHGSQRLGSGCNLFFFGGGGGGRGRSKTFNHQCLANIQCSINVG